MASAPSSVASVLGGLADAANEQIEEMASTTAEVDKQGVDILFATDLHLNVNAPTNRLDDYGMAMVAKMVYVFQYATEHDIDLVIFGGDFGHRPGLPVRLVNPITAALVDYIRPTNQRPFGGQVILCVGSHDLHGHNVLTYPQGPLGTLELAGANPTPRVHIGADPTKPFAIALNRLRFRGGDIGVACVPEQQTESDMIESLNSLIHLQDKVQIVCLHHPICLNDHPMNHVHPDDVLTGPKQAVLCGHIHWPQGVYRSTRGSVFVMPGSMARREHTDRDRQPQMAHLHIGPKSGIELLRIPCASGSSVFTVPEMDTKTESVARRVEAAKINLATTTADSSREALQAAMTGEPDDVIHAVLSAWDEAQG